MKSINKILLISVAVMAIASCTYDFRDINTDPNKTNVGQIPARNMFEPLLYGSGNVWQQYTHYWSNELIQFTAFTGGTTRQEHRYFISDGNWQNVWDLYSRYANNAVHMYELASNEDDDALKAIATTMKVLFMSNLTDMFGDIPYAEAFQGRLGGTKTPKYDSQQSVYEQMFAELETANGLYAENPPFPYKELDGMYGGSMTQWRKFNNSLYLRLLCRVSGRPVMNSGVKMTEILNNPGKYPIFTSNDDNAKVTFTGSDPYRSYFADEKENGFTSGGRKLTQQLIKMTVITENGQQTYIDPRLPVYGKKNPNTGELYNPKNIWIGTVAGCTSEQMPIVDRGTAWLNFAVLARADAPGYFMDYAEVQFIFAEAALKGLITGGQPKAKEYYTAAVTASMEKWAAFGQYSETPVTITAGDISEFLNSDLGSFDRAQNKEALIANQKFLALFWIGMDAYHEYRRTGYPVLTIGDGATNNNDGAGNKVLPKRFAFPNTSMATNRANADAAIERMRGGNDMLTPVWWSKDGIELIPN